MNGILANGRLCRGAIRYLTSLTVATGLTIAVTACATTTAHSAGTTHSVRTVARPHAATRASVTSVRLAPHSAAPTWGNGPISYTYRGPHFNTPQAAMRFLAAAYNHHNAKELHWVTTPASYARLMGMRSEAINLRLRYCTLNRKRGDYTCHFRHDYPPSLHKTGHGAATFIAAPALTPGWYMYTFVGCG
jgi:hypothetical protein